jgi:hypothetical protein
MKAEPSAAVYVDLSWAAHVALGEAAIDDEELVEVVVLSNRVSRALYEGCSELIIRRGRSCGGIRGSSPGRMNGSALLFPPNSPKCRSHVVVVYGMELVVVVLVNEWISSVFILPYSRSVGILRGSSVRYGTTRRSRGCGVRSSSPETMNRSVRCPLPMFMKCQVLRSSDIWNENTR